MSRKPVAEGLFEEGPDGPCLFGARRLNDGKIVFPMPEGSDAEGYERFKLSPRGRLWSFTVQRFRPKSPPYVGNDDDRTFKPYALGYVELPGEVIVEARIETENFAALKIGMPMHLALAPFARDASGADIITFVFRPG